MDWDDGDWCPHWGAPPAGAPVGRVAVCAPEVASEAASEVTPGPESGGLPVVVGAAVPAERPYVQYTDNLALEICERLAAGESLMSICREARMPHHTTVREWRWRKPRFGEGMAAAMRAARYRKRRAALAKAMKPRDARGLWSTYTPEVGAEICRRLTEGESLIAICRTEGMPHYATVLNWARAVPAFGDAYALARRLATDHLFDEAREIALAVTPGPVWADSLRFRILRWQVARASARVYVETMPEFEALVRQRTEERLSEEWMDKLGLEPDVDD